MTPAKLRWGLLLITVGVMLLLNESNKLGWDYWLELASWWPVLLIALGFEKIFVRSKLQFISYLSPVALICFMAWVAVDVGPGSYDDRGNFFESRRWSKEMDDSVTGIKATISHDHSNLYIDRSGYDMVSAKFDRFTRKPDVDYEIVDGIANVDISGKSRFKGAIIISSRKFGNDWRVRLTDELPVELACIGRGSDVNLHVENITLEKLNIENDQGEIYLKIGRLSPTVSLNIEGYDAEFRVRIPTDAGVKVYGDRYSDYLEKIGYLKQPDCYCTDGFEDSAVQIVMTLDNELKHLSIVHY